VPSIASSACTRTDVDDPDRLRDIAVEVVYPATSSHP
jgi:hypothetical protein